MSSTSRSYRKDIAYISQGSVLFMVSDIHWCLRIYSHQIWGTTGPCKGMGSATKQASLLQSLTICLSAYIPFS